ncbi:MAG: hypothetical protein GX219_09340 [Tissierellia bacterium]|nr:hypothetical protein [Tissierellia bacterium]
MKERIKSFLLIFLMVSALFLIKQILGVSGVGIIVTAENSKEALEGASYLLEDMILPEKKLISFGENYKTIIYNESDHRLYSSIRDPLAKVLSSKEIKIEEVGKATDRFIDFKFSNPINSFLLSKSLGNNESNHVPKEIVEIENISIEIGPDFNKMVLSNSEKAVSIKLPKEDFIEMEEIFTQIEKEENYDYYYSVRSSFGADTNLYFPYEITKNISNVYVDNSLSWMNSADKRQIARKYLGAALNTAQEMEEEIGKTVFIAERDILKIEDNGIIEYQSILDRDVKNRNLLESTNTVIKEISEKIPDKKGLYLNRIKEIESGASKGYKFIFEYRIMGYPVLYSTGNYLEMDVFNDKLKYMRVIERRESKRNSDFPEPGVHIKSSFDILEKEYELFKKYYMEDNKIPVKDIEEVSRNEVISWIKDTRLSFFDNSLKNVGSSLIPAWIFETESWILGFEALTGNLIYQESK